MRKIFLATPIFLSCLYTVALALTQGINIGVDVFFHLKIAEVWASGHVGMLSPFVLAINNMPYPPLFHFLLVPGILLGIEIPWVTWVQVLLMPIAVASFMFLSYKLYGTTLSFFSGFLVLGCTAYLDRVVQPQPQALDFILLPVAFFCYLFLKRRGYVFSSVLMIWNHGIVSLSALGGTLLGYVRKRDWNITFAFLLGSGLMLALTFAYLVPALNQFSSSAQNDQEYAFWHLPLFVPFYLGFLIVGFPIAFYQASNWIRKRFVSSVDKLALLTVLSTSIMIPVWPDRWIQYCTIPLSLLILSQIYRSKSTARFFWFIAIILFYFINGTFALSIRLLLG